MVPIGWAEIPNFLASKKLKKEKNSSLLAMIANSAVESSTRSLFSMLFLFIDTSTINGTRKPILYLESHI